MENNKGRRNILYAIINAHSRIKKKKNMENNKIFVSDTHAEIDHELRRDDGKQIEWVAPDGTVRIPEEGKKDFPYPGDFVAAGKAYASWEQLCVEKEENGCVCKDIYGRKVFYMAERFPCFDSYDYAYEKRYYRWFFLKQNGRLTRVYYADERNQIQVTEDVRNLENKCREQMQNLGWLK